MGIIYELANLQLFFEVKSAWFGVDFCNILKTILQRPWIENSGFKKETAPNIDFQWVYSNRLCPLYHRNLTAGHRVTILPLFWKVIFTFFNRKSCVIILRENYNLKLVLALRSHEREFGNTKIKCSYLFRNSVVLKRRL